MGCGRSRFKHYLYYTVFGVRSFRLFYFGIRISVSFVFCVLMLFRIQIVPLQFLCNFISVRYNVM